MYRPSLACTKRLRHPCLARVCARLFHLGLRCSAQPAGKVRQKPNQKPRQKRKATSKAETALLNAPSPSSSSPRRRGSSFPGPFSEEKEHRSPYACQQKTLARMARMGKNSSFGEWYWPAGTKQKAPLPIHGKRGRQSKTTALSAYLPPLAFHSFKAASVFSTW